MTNKVKAAAGVAGVGGLMMGLWFVARSGVPSEQRVADAEPPPAAEAFGELEERVLADVVVVRGRVEVQNEVEVRGPTAPTEGVLPVVVDIPVDVGDEVANGDVVAVVADRPVIVVEMLTRMYRELRPNDEGADVERFQQALVGLGYQVPVDGEFGPMTQGAVRRLYKDRGFDPVETVVPQEAEAGSGMEAGPEEETGPQPAAPESGEGVGPPRREAEEQKEEKGLMVPLGEVVGVRDLPAIVSGVPVAVGDEVSESPVAVLSPSDYVLRAELEPDRAALLTPGTVGAAKADGKGREWEVEVLASGEDAALDSSASQEQGSMDDGAMEDAVAQSDSGALLFAPAEPLGIDMLGTSVRIEVTVESTDGPVLAAPIAAIRTGADGEYLRTVGGEGKLRQVRIEPGASIGGWVELVDPGDLEPGMTVLLG